MSLLLVAFCAKRWACLLRSMVSINLICIGKLKEIFLRGAETEYLKRLQAFAKLTVIELPESRISSDNDIGRSIENEGTAILAKIKGYVISMCIEGQQFSSESLAAHIASITLNGVSEISIVIGGSCGLSERVKQRSDCKLSMSKMTFPHQLARVMTLEQIYRCFQINNNGKYHK